MDADTIVVGAGSAGAVIAARVTERADHTVLLLEAGPDYPDPRAVPADLLDGRRNSMRAHDWGYRHRPTPGQVPFDFPRGRVVGGSSAVNTCIALRGQPYDYDEWAALGLPEWSWERCLPAFKRLETDLDHDNEWHGQDGPIPIRRHTRDELTPWQAGFWTACMSMGFPSNPDHNDPTRTGVGPHAMNKVDGQRMSAARCYLTPEVRARDNLRVQGDTLVRRVLFENLRAVGVEVEHSGEVRTLRSPRVVLSAGAIATPGILLRSGIGPTDDVARLGVTQVADVPAVGAQLLDHPGSAIILVPRPGVSHVDHPLIQTTLRYRSEHSPCDNEMQLQAGSFFPLPELRIPLVIISCQVGKPRGVGSIRFESADPHHKPRIDTEAFVDQVDRARAVEAMELAWLVASAPPLRDLAWFMWPRESVLSSRATIDRWVWKSCGSGYHPCGSVPMGPEGSPTAAVDGRGRVRGVDGLVVADASIMPTIPSANTNLPTLMIGERFGEWLRGGNP